MYKTTRKFWDYYHRLPRDIQRRADKQFELLKQNPDHPSLMLKKTQQGTYWSARVNDDYRVLAIEHEGILTWVWIGKHGEYDRRI
ncbi:MAG: hypothetical protein OYL97_17520 [Candidatus Poribacteria bacterium]|nr:hypothetical protein [Candidatus Poribacteria bacterium]